MKLVIKKSSRLCTSLVALIAVLQLALWPIENAMAECAAADQKACEAKKDQGFSFDTTGCRCVGSRERQAMRDRFLECQQKPTAAEQQSCINSNANASAALGDTGAGDWQEVLGDIQGGVTGIATTVALYNFLGAKNTEPGCASRLIFSATALVAFGAEVYSYFFLEKKLHELRDQYANYVESWNGAGSGSASGTGPASRGDAGGLENQTDATLKSHSAYDAQILAFDYLKKEQEIIADVAGTKQITYIIAAVGFGAAMVMAIAESIVPTMIKCTLSPASPELFTWQNFEEDLSPLQASVFQMIKSAIMAEAMASSTVTGGKTNRDGFILQTSGDGKSTNVEDKSLFISLITGAAVALGGISETFRGYMRSSITVGVISGVSMLLNSFLAYIAGEEKTMAEENAKKAQKIKDAFVNSMVGYCPGGRENMADANCYCYLDGGKKNPNRTNSATCQALWQKNDQNFFSGKKSDTFTGDGSVLGCITINRQFDADCQCKKFIDKKSGKNACYSVPMGASSFGGLGAGLGVGSTINDLNSLSNGGVNKNLVNVNDLKQRAARTKDLGRQLLKKLNDDRAKNKLPSLDMSPKALANFVNNNVPKQILTGASKLSPENLNGPERPVNDAIKAAMAKTGMDKKYEYTGGGGGKKATEEKKGFNFEMDNGGGNASGEAKVDDSFMEKKFNYKDNDIVNNEGASIWQVISNRYTKSALPRLFATDAEIKAMNGEADQTAPSP